MAAVIGDQPVAQRLVGRDLQLRIEACAHRQPALVQRLVAIARDQFAADLLGEIGGVDDFGVFAAAQRQRLGLGGNDIGIGRNAILGHAVENPVPPSLCRLRKPARIVVVRRFWQAGEIGSLAKRQLVKRLVEVGQRRRRDAISARAEIDLVQIEFEDPVLWQRLVDSGGEQNFPHLAGDRQLVRQQHVLGDLLRNRRGADRSPLAVPPPDIGQCRAQHRDRIDAMVRVEILVLGREERVDNPLRDRRDRHKDPALGRVFGEQPAVSGLQPRRNRRLVMG